MPVDTRPISRLITLSFHRVAGYDVPFLRTIPVGDADKGTHPDAGSRVLWTLQNPQILTCDSDARLNVL